MSFLPIDASQIAFEDDAYFKEHTPYSKVDITEDSDVADLENELSTIIDDENELQTIYDNLKFATDKAKDALDSAKEYRSFLESQLNNHYEN